MQSTNSRDGRAIALPRRRPLPPSINRFLASNATLPAPQRRQLVSSDRGSGAGDGVTIRIQRIEILSLVLILMVSRFIKNTIRLHFIPGSIPICVQMVLYGDERIVCSTAGRRCEAIRFLPDLGRRVSLLGAKVLIRRSPSNPHLERQHFCDRAFKLRRLFYLCLKLWRPPSSLPLSGGGTKPLGHL